MMRLLGLLLAVGGFGVLLVMASNLRGGLDGRKAKWMIGGLGCGVVGFWIASVSG